MNIEHYNIRLENPLHTTPNWASRVERWYQLDAYSYAICELYSALKTSLKSPSLIFLASPRGSNETDFHFVSQGVPSPAKFVHTLPSVRGSALCQVMDWSGPILCLQADPHTLTTSLGEALFSVNSESPHIWVIAILKQGSLKLRDGTYEAHLFEISESSNLSRGKPSMYAASKGPEGSIMGNDTQCIEWFSSQNKQNIPLPLGPSGYQIERLSHGTRI